MKDNKIFFDTNILIYIVKDNTGKAEIASSILSINTTAYISIQVINEFCNVAIKKLDFLKDDILFSIDKFSKNFIISEISIPVIKSALEIKEKYKYSYYDSVIIASALQNNCRILYTEDMQHNQIIEDKLKIVNPFL